MFFYLIFFWGLISGRVFQFTSVVIIGLLAAGLVFEFSNPIMSTYTSPLLLEFLVGVWIASLYLNGKLPKYTIWLLPTGFVGLFLLPVLEGQFLEVWGRILCSSFIVAGAVSLGTKTPYIPFAKLLGDASYSIYLTHTFVGLVLARRLWNLTPVTGWPQFIGWGVLSLCVSMAAGVLVYLYFEKPLLKWLRGILLPIADHRSSLVKST